MVNQASIAFMFLSLIISFFLPIGLTIYYYKKKEISLKPVFVGVLVFFVSQLVLRIPILQLLSTQKWYKSMEENSILISLFLGLTAGLFEELGRFVGFKYILKENLDRNDGIAFGIGHGGIEAILVVGITSINNIYYSFSINSGNFDKVIAPSINQKEITDAIKNQLITTPSYYFAISGVERIFAFTLQIALSILVLYGVKNEKFEYVVYAILLHMIIDSPLGIMQANGVNLFLIEGYIALTAVVAFIFILKSKELFVENKQQVRDNW